MDFFLPVGSALLTGRQHSVSQKRGENISTVGQVARRQGSDYSPRSVTTKVSGGPAQLPAFWGVPVGVVACRVIPAPQKPLARHSQRLGGESGGW